MKKILAVAAMFALSVSTASAQTQKQILEKIGIEQKVGAQLPLDAAFKDENGRDVKLGDYFGKRPVVFAPVYYECPMLCGLVLQGAVRSLNALPFTVGQEFDVVALSFDPNEGPSLAAAKKANVVKEYLKGGASTAAGWHFLTGSEEQIKRVTDAVGFRYQWDPSLKQYGHAGAVLVVTPEGKVNRYFMGVDYSAKEMKYSLMESSKNRIGTVIDQVLFYCYHYNPMTGPYGKQILFTLRLAGILTVVLLARFVFVSIRNEGRAAGGAVR